MKSITISEFESASKTYPQGWQEEILKLGIIHSDRIEISEENYTALNLKYRLPSLMEKIRNFARSAAEAAATGLDVRGAEETEKILSICGVCPYLVVEQFICGKCGCKLEYKTKFHEFKCPMGKW